MAEKRSVLVIGAHSDECEFCAGGLTLRLIEKGYRAVFLNTVGDLSYWSTVGPRKNEESVEDAKRAAAVLGAEKILLPYNSWNPLLLLSRYGRRHDRDARDSKDSTGGESGDSDDPLGEGQMV